MNKVKHTPWCSSVARCYACCSLAAVCRQRHHRHEGTGRNKDSDGSLVLYAISEYADVSPVDDPCFAWED